MLMRKRVSTSRRRVVCRHGTDDVAKEEWTIKKMDLLCFVASFENELCAKIGESPDRLWDAGGAWGKESPKYLSARKYQFDDF